LERKIHAYPGAFYYLRSIREKTPGCKVFKHDDEITPFELDPKGTPVCRVKAKQGANWIFASWK